MRNLLLTVLFAAMSAPAQAQPTDEAAPEEIVVQPPEITDVARAFVTELSASVPYEPMGRWDRTICPGVAGMRGRYAQALIDRIATVAARVELEVGEPGCRANILIFVAQDSEALTADIMRQRRLMSHRNRTGNTRGADALADFAETPRPVRWWHVSRTLTGDGVEFDSVAYVPIASRIENTTRQDFHRAVIVVDADDIHGLRFGAVADYVAMVALAQIDPNADVSGLPTILNLFSPNGADRPDRLTSWDYAYLEGLYTARRDARYARQQERQIAGAVADALSEATD
jgi:hypothetical protein